MRRREPVEHRQRLGDATGHPQAGRGEQQQVAVFGQRVEPRGRRRQHLGMIAGRLQSPQPGDVVGDGRRRPGRQ